MVNQIGEILNIPKSLCQLNCVSNKIKQIENPGNKIKIQKDDETIINLHLPPVGKITKSRHNKKFYYAH